MNLLKRVPLIPPRVFAKMPLTLLQEDLIKLIAKFCMDNFLCGGGGGSPIKRKYKRFCMGLPQCYHKTKLLKNGTIMAKHVS